MWTLSDMSRNEKERGRARALWNRQRNQRSHGTYLVHKKCFENITGFEKYYVIVERFVPPKKLYRRPKTQKITTVKIKWVLSPILKKTIEIISYERST